MNGILSVSSLCELCLSVVFLGAVFACGYSGVRVAAFFEKNWHISSHLLLKSVSSLHRRLSLRN